MWRALVVCLVVGVGVGVAEEAAADSEAARVTRMVNTLPRLAEIERGRTRVTVRGVVARGIPAWLNEGIAALYGSSRWTGRRFEFLVNYRLRDLQRVVRERALPSIAELAASTSDEVRGERGAVYYALARYALLFVERQGRLEALYAALRAARDVAEQRTILTSYVDDRQFIAWVRKLR